VFFSRWRDMLIKYRTETTPLPPLPKFLSDFIFIIFQYAIIAYTSMCLIWLRCWNMLHFVPNIDRRDVMRGTRSTAVTCRIASMSPRCTSVTYVEIQSMSLQRKLAKHVFGNRACTVWMSARWWTVVIVDFHECIQSIPANPGTVILT
jgi:hypothetical protein